MPVVCIFADGGIEVGEDKRLLVIPKDTNGDPIPVFNLDLEIETPDGERSFGLGDFSVEDSTYELFIQHDERGKWYYTLAAEDSRGNTEKVRWDKRVE
jgi:hypothetical protein